MLELTVTNVANSNCQVCLSCILAEDLKVKEKTRGVLLGIFRGGMPPGSPNPDPISDEKTLFFEPIFKPGL